MVLTLDIFFLLFLLYFLQKAMKNNPVDISRISPNKIRKAVGKLPTVAEEKNLFNYFPKVRSPVTEM